MGSSVEDFGDRPEGFLASGIPDLQFKDLVFYSNDKGAEFHTYCNIMLLFELILH